MALFEIDNGRLVAAHFGFDANEGLSTSVLNLLRSQILEVVERPLFPVSWHAVDSGADGPDGGPRRLIALDATAQVVSVEIMQELNAVTLVEALTRLGEASAKGWMELADEFPGGMEEFRTRWSEFREAMPASFNAGPRLIIVAGKIDPAVNAALEALAKSGVEVHRVGLRRMSNGREFIQSEQVDFVRSGALQTALGLGSANGRSQLSARPGARSSGYGPGHVDSGLVMPEQVEEEPLTEPEPTEEPEPTPEPEPAVTGIIAHDAQGLAAIAEIVGEDVPLYLGDKTAKLLVAGLIECGDGTVTQDPYMACASLDVEVDDPWQAWVIGDPAGPTLAEAIAEINEVLAAEAAL